MAARNAVPLIPRLLWRVPLSPPTPQYARAALAQGRSPQALPRLGVLRWRSQGEHSVGRALSLKARIDSAGLFGCVCVAYLRSVKSLMFRQRKGGRVV